MYSGQSAIDHLVTEVSKEDSGRVLTGGNIIPCLNLLGMGLKACRASVAERSLTGGCAPGCTACYNEGFAGWGANFPNLSRLTGWLMK